MGRRAIAQRMPPDKLQQTSLPSWLLRTWACLKTNHAKHLLLFHSLDHSWGINSFFHISKELGIGNRDPHYLWVTWGMFDPPMKKTTSILVGKMQRVDDNNSLPGLRPQNQTTIGREKATGLDGWKGFSFLMYLACFLLYGSSNFISRKIHRDSWRLEQWPESDVHGPIQSRERLMQINTRLFASDGFSTMIA